MTIIVGIVVHDDQIIMASDSQTTDGNRKRLDAKKIHVVDFKHDAALIAESGFSELSARAITMIRERAAGLEMDSPWAVADLCQQVMAEIRTMMCAGFPPGFTLEGIQRYIENEREFSLTVAHFWNFKPRFFTISNATQVASPRHGKTVANGCGADLAEYLLAQYYAPAMKFGEAAALAIYVIEKVKQSNPFCGGPTQAAILQCYSKEQLELVKEEHGEDVFRSVGGLLPGEWAAGIAKAIPSMEAQNNLAMRMQMAIHFNQVFRSVEPPPKPPETPPPSSKG